jgi:hypothetical protein
VNIHVLDNDAFGGSLDVQSLTIVTPPSHGTSVVVAGRNIGYTSDAGYEGVDSLAYEVCDAFGCDRAVVTVTVSP